MSEEWTPSQKRLRDELVDEVAYVLGEPPGSQRGLEVVLKVLRTLERLGWQGEESDRATMTRAEQLLTLLADPDTTTEEG